MLFPDTGKKNLVIHTQRSKNLGIHIFEDENVHR